MTKPTKVSTEVELDKILGIYAMAERDLTYKFHMIGDTQAMRKMTNSAHERATSEATHSITQLIDKAVVSAIINELSNIRENLDMTVIAWRTLGKAGAVPTWIPKLDESYTEWIKELDKRLAELTPKEQLK